VKIRGRNMHFYFETMYFYFPTKEPNNLLEAARLQWLLWPGYTSKFIYLPGKIHNACLMTYNQ